MQNNDRRDEASALLFGLALAVVVALVVWALMN